jgi:predicted ATPase
MRSKTISVKRLIVTGASGVGKTTLVEKLAPLLHLQIIPELGRKLCRELGYNYIGEIPDQEAFKWQVLKAQIEEESKQSICGFISDRSTLDCWVLWQRWNICQAMSYDTERYYEECRQHARLYTHIVVVPPMFEPVDDGFRWTDKDYQRQIDRLIRMTLYDWNLLERTLLLRSLDPGERIEEIVRGLGSIGLQLP